MAHPDSEDHSWSSTTQSENPIDVLLKFLKFPLQTERLFSSLYCLFLHWFSSFSRQTGHPSKQIGQFSGQTEKPQVRNKFFLNLTRRISNISKKNYGI